MNSIYLPVSNNDSKNNNIKIYNMMYNKEALKNFLNYVKVYYQDKRINRKLADNLDEYKVEPLLYNILEDITSFEVLDLRSLEMYMCANFKKRLSNNYTENDKINILLQLKESEEIDEGIQYSSSEELSNDIYRIRIREAFKNLTISERNMSMGEFEDLLNKFFDLFDIEELKMHRNFIEYIMNEKYDIAPINSKILRNRAFQKVCQKIF